jgi:lipopolysaccharide assembly outer membrane protein LptD (OstA)
MRPKLALGAVFLILLLPLCRAEWRFEAETGAVYDSNLSNSDRVADVRDDWAWRSDVSAGNAMQLTRDLRLNVRANVRGELWDRFGDFNNIGAGASAGLRYRFGLGRQAPWLLLEDRVGYDHFQDNAQSGNDNVVSLRGGIALSERIALEANYNFETHVAADDFYDRQVHRAGARVAFDVTSLLQVAIGYDYREGDVISYAVPPRPEIAQFATEREDEDEFGIPLRTAYKFAGRTHALSVAASYQVTKYASVQLSYDYAVTTREPVQYEKHLVEAKIALAY